MPSRLVSAKFGKHFRTKRKRKKKDRINKPIYVALPIYFQRHEPGVTFRTTQVIRGSVWGRERSAVLVIDLCKIQCDMARVKGRGV